MPRYENFIKTAVGLFLLATVVGGTGVVTSRPLLTLVAAFVVAVAWALLFAGLVAGALRPLLRDASRDLAAQLAQLATLHDAGKLSDAEYAEAKRRCLVS